MYTRHHTVSSTATQTQLGNVTSRVTPHRAIVTAPPSVHWSAQQEVPSMNTNSGGAHHQRNCCRRHGSSNTAVASATAKTRQRGSYDTAVGSRFVPQLRESLYATSNTTERLSQEMRRRISRQHRHLTIKLFHRPLLVLHKR